MSEFSESVYFYVCTESVTIVQNRFFKLLEMLHSLFLCYVFPLTLI